MERKIIQIDENLCTGCGVCIPNCPEGAIQIIDQKARLISDIYCDGLGACIGKCPYNAIQTIVREAGPYDEKKVMTSHIIPQGENTIIAHLNHLLDHGEIEFYQLAFETLRESNVPIPQGFYEKGKIPNHLLVKQTDLILESCPEGGCLNNSNLAENPAQTSKLLVSDSGSDRLKLSVNPLIQREALELTQKSELTNWPIQIKLTPVKTQAFHHSHLLIAADCVIANHPNFHGDVLVGKTLLMGCPKFDDRSNMIQKLTQIFLQNEIVHLTIAIMEVACCSGLVEIVQTALESAIQESSQKSRILVDVLKIPLYRKENI